MFFIIYDSHNVKMSIFGVKISFEIEPRVFRNFTLKISRFLVQKEHSVRVFTVSGLTP